MHELDEGKNNNKVEKRVIHFLNSYHIILQQILGPHGTGYINYVYQVQVSNDINDKAILWLTGCTPTCFQHNACSWQTYHPKP